MKYTLFVPGLTWLDSDAGPELCKDLALPALSTLLGRGQWRSEPLSASEMLCRTFGLPQPALAANLAHAAGLPPAVSWLIADPVNLRVDRDRALLGDIGIMNLSQDEAAALLASLNAFFAEDGLVFHAPTPARWFVALPQASGAEFSALPDVVGEDINHHLPKGANGMRWSRFLNELQMLLYTHPVNEAREARGEPTVNSLWFWGEASQPQPLASAYPAVHSHDPLWQQLAQQAGVVGASPSYAFTLAEGAGDVLLHLDAAEGAAQFRDVWGWREGLLQLERDWFAPTLAALQQGRLSEVQLCCHGSAGLHSRTTRLDLWKLWRRPLPLSKLYPQ
ncbi:hypothetical protein [Vogesella sp. AC12]|uniref:hypothetical protein n=1 Tax=Vogesella sp. AC12 TaxID=2950550 RepID=UPI002108A0C0|nr:hypothetical protein [Vogesella sp. AC12]MCQ4145127.1 hypothetical protein [Vogesella sp. AC12]